jgi:hypothetical protein
VGDALAGAPAHAVHLIAQLRDDARNVFYGGE